MFVRQGRNCRWIADTGDATDAGGLWHSPAAVNSASSCQTLMAPLQKGALTALPLGIFLSLLYGLEAGCTVLALTHICRTQGAPRTICCLWFTVVSFSVGLHLLWFVFWAEYRHFTTRFISLYSPLQSLTRVSSDFLCNLLHKFRRKKINSSYPLYIALG